MHSPVNRNKMTCLLVAALLLTARLASSAEFFPLGFETYTNPGANNLNVSEDGTVVVGGAPSPFLPEDSLMRWTRAAGSEILEHPTGGEALVSSDGSIVVATRWGVGIRKFTPEGIEDFPDFSSRALSRDGSTILGIGFGTEGNFVLLTNEHVTDLDIPRAHLVSSASADLSTIVGWGGNAQRRNNAFRWTEEEGLRYLTGLDDELGVGTAALGISSDGRWTVGSTWGPKSGTFDKALRWDLFSPAERLAPLNDNWGNRAIDVTADGRTVVGNLYLSDELNERPTDRVAGIWTEGIGKMVPLQDLLVTRYELGQALDGYHLQDVHDVTDDGRFMVGNMLNHNGDREAFLVDLGLRGDFNGDESRDIDDLNMLSAAIQSNDNNLTFDLDYSNTVDFEDQRYWVKELKNTWFGDANLDGEFNSNDFTQVFLAGQYEDAIADNSGWAEGDWDGDADFTSKDMIAAFLDGGYEQGPRGAISAVPEPTSAWLLLMGAAFLALRTGRLARRANR